MLKKDTEILAEHQNELSGPDQAKWESACYYGENPQRMTREEWESFKKLELKTEIRAEKNCAFAPGRSLVPHQ